MLFAGTWRRAFALPGPTVCLVLALMAGGGLLCGGAEAPGQTGFSFRGWQTDDGLPQNSVKAIAQTRDGYLWLATFNGLARFDGLRFTVFDTANVPGLPANRLVWLHADREGGLWLVTEYHELARLFAGQCQVFDSAEGLPPEGVEWLSEDGQGVLWVAVAGGGLGRLQAGRFVPVACPPELAKGRMTSIASDAAGRVWFNREGRVAWFAQGKFTLLEAPSGNQPVAVDCLCRSRDGGLWMVTPQELRKLHDGLWSPESWPRPDLKSHLEAALEDADGNLWLATYSNGLFRFRPPETWDHFTENSGLTSQRLRSLFLDREGNLWVGTDGGGLNRVGTSPWRMVTRRDGLGVDAVHSVSQDLQGRIWFGGGTTKPYWLDQGQVTVAIASPRSDLLAGVWAILPARDGAMWIGTYAGTVFCYRGEALAGYGEAEGMLTGSVRALLEDRQGAIWAGGPKGLCRIQNGRATHFARQSGLSSEKVRALAEAADGSHRGDRD
jgi:ligand-binding sensor domain-containing protein